VGDYEVLRYLASGGMSDVYEARHKSGMRAALKIIRPDRRVDEAGKRRFLREQRIHAQLVNPRVVRQFEVGTTPNDLLYVANEFLSRGDAEPLAGKKTNVESMAMLAIDMFDALAFSHARGFVHRDVKPANLLLAAPDEQRRPRAKLSDFGLAKSYRDVGGTLVTKDDEVGGSACFVAPEQLLGFKDVGPSADVYSAAATLYFLLTEEIPVKLDCSVYDATAPQLCLAALSNDRVPIRRRRSDVDPVLAQWIDTLVCHDITQRVHLRAQTVADALRGFLG